MATIAQEVTNVLGEKRYTVFVQDYDIPIAANLIEEMHKKMLERGPSRISPFFIPGLIVNLASGQVSIRFNARGPNSAPATACATGAQAQHIE